MVPSRKEAQEARRRGYGARQWGFVISFVAVAGLAVGAVIARPRASLRPSRHGLAHLRISNFLGAPRIQSTFTYHHRVFTLGDQKGRLAPRRPVPPGVSGVVRVRIHRPPWLAWIPGQPKMLTLSVVTPRSPGLQATHAARRLLPSVTVHFRRAVREVIYRQGTLRHVLTFSTPVMSARLPLTKPRPGQTGRVMIQTSPSSWVKPGRPQILRWTAVPYLTVSTTVSYLPGLRTPLTVKFSQPLASADLSGWTVKPHLAGNWRKVNATTYTFTPSGLLGYGPNARIAITIPSGTAGPVAESGAYLASSATLTVSTPPGSVTRLQQLLAEAGYLPVGWHPAGHVRPRTTLAAQAQAIYQAPKGTFNWKYPALPTALDRLWTPGHFNVITKGAIMQFERVNHLTVDGIPGPAVWSALIADHLSHRVSPDGYTYISVSENLPEKLSLWVNGKRVLTSLTNTGIRQTPTYLGTYPIFERLAFQIMKGKNPSGVHYADPVHWINYFAGSDAVHGFLRSAYGFPQSLGCVELPIANAYRVFQAVHYGTLVTVHPAGSSGTSPTPVAVKPSTKKS